jgi:AcrR family transcriptional regulator
MKRPSLYTRENIIDAAVALIREQGWAQVTTRKIARRMGSSTMPIYSHVKSVDELEHEIRARVRSMLKEFQLRSYTDQPLLNLAFGYVAFARDEKQLFRFLYLDSPDVLESGNLSGMKESFLEQFGKDSPVGAALSAMEEAGEEAMIQNTWIFTHGLAMLVNSGSLGSCPDNTILGYLQGAGEAFYLLGRKWRDGK